MTAGQLRKLAAAVREKAAELKQVRMQKCAQVLTAAKGLVLLRSKVRDV
jgi:hypothetical protein